MIDCGGEVCHCLLHFGGCGAFSLSTYEVINLVVAAIGTDHWPNLSALSRSLSSLSPENVVRLTEYGISKGCLYFQ